MIDMAISIGVAAGALSAVTLFAVAGRRWPAIGWALIGFTAISATDQLKEPIAHVASAAIYSGDLFAVALVVIALSQLSSWSSVSIPVRVLFFGLGMLVVSSFARGYYLFGTPAVVEVRPFFYALAGIWWALTLRWADPNVRRLASNSILLIGALLTMVALVNLASRGIASSSSFYVDETGTYRSLRPVISSQAMFIACAALVALNRWLIDRRRIFGMLALLMVGVALLSQHRSVWAALMVGASVILLRTSSLQRQKIAPVFSAGLLILSIFVASGLLDGLLGTFGQSIDAIGEQGSTWTDRTSGWSQLLSELLRTSDGSLFFGHPMGWGYLRIGPNGQYQTYQPHNWFVQMALRTGLLGAALVLSIITAAFVKLWKEGLEVTASLAVLCSLAFFLIAYGLESYIAPLIGMCWGVAFVNVSPQTTDSQFSPSNSKLPVSTAI